MLRFDFFDWTDRQHWPDHVNHLQIRLNEGLIDEIFFFGTRYVYLSTGSLWSAVRLMDQISSSRWWRFRSSDAFEHSRILLDVLEHPLAMFIEWETFINVIAEVFVHGCSLNGMLTNRDRECWNEHSSIYPLPFGLREIDRLFPVDGVGLGLIQCFLACSLHLRCEFSSMPPWSGIDDQCKFIGEQMRMGGWRNSLSHYTLDEKKQNQSEPCVIEFRCNICGSSGIR